MVHMSLSLLQMPFLMRSKIILASIHFLKIAMEQLMGRYLMLIDMARYCSWKGHISTNLLAACHFNLLFCYLLSGWEGSAADGCVFDDACRTDFEIPSGTYYLGDAGFPLCDVLLVPYRGVQYHLKEWVQSGQRYHHLSCDYWSNF